MDQNCSENADLEAWALEVVNEWRQQGIELNKGATEQQLKETEAKFNFQFEPSFRALYKQVNGFRDNDWTEDMITLWPLERIILESWPAHIIFADHCIRLFDYSFHPAQTGIYKSWNYTRGESVKILGTFREAINLIRTGDLLLL